MADDDQYVNDDYTSSYPSALPTAYPSAAPSSFSPTSEPSAAPSGSPTSMPSVYKAMSYPTSHKVVLAFGAILMITMIALYFVSRSSAKAKRVQAQSSQPVKVNMQGQIFHWGEDTGGDDDDDDANSRTRLTSWLNRNDFSKFYV